MSSRFLFKKLGPLNLKRVEPLIFYKTSNGKLFSSNNTNYVTCSLSRVEHKRHLQLSHSYVFNPISLRLFGTRLNEFDNDMTSDSTIFSKEDKKKLMIRKIYGIAMESFFEDLNSGNTKFTFSYFEDLEKEFLKENNSKAKVFADFVMKQFQNVKNLDGGKLFMSFLIEKGKQISFTTKLSYLALLGDTNENHELDDMIFSEYEQILEMIELEFCESELMNILIRALASTQQFKKGYGLLSIFREKKLPSFLSYYPLLIASLRNSDFEFFEFLMKEFCESSNTIQAENTELQNVFEMYLSLCEKKKANVSDFLNLLSRFDLYPNEDVALRIEKNLAEAYGWRGKLTSVNPRGICKNCGWHLKKHKPISKEEFKLLKDSFLDRTVHEGKGLFWSSPEEIKRFEEFLKQREKFNFVVDILNVTNIHRKIPKYKMAQLVDNRLSNFGRILMITRSHFQPKVNNSEIFVCSNSTYDDYFTLFAALNSGSMCKFVSNDFFRDAKFKLGEEIGLIFMKWQRTRQVRIRTASNGVSGNIFDYPNVFDARAQESDQGWHIPYTPSRKKLPYDIPYNFLCVKK